MGEIIKTITIEVPTNIIYDSLKRIYLSDAKEKYCNDFRMVKKGLRTILSKDIPNTHLTFSGSQWGAKAELSFILHSIGNSLCEVTINYQYRLVLELSVEADIIHTIESLLMLEQGYQNKKR